MNKRGLSYTLLIMIALQSLFAVASQQRPHQLDLDHLKIEHSHQLDKSSTGSDREVSQSQSSSHNIEDCHHCGHCHGSHSVNWVNYICGFLLGQRQQNKPPPIQFAYLQAFADNLLRPPIFS